MSGDLFMILSQPQPARFFPFSVPAPEQDFFDFEEMEKSADVTDGESGAPK